MNKNLKETFTKVCDTKQELRDLTSRYNDEKIELVESCISENLVDALTVNLARVARHLRR